MTLSSMFEPQDPAPVPPISRTVKAVILGGCTTVTAAVLLLEIYGNPETNRPSVPSGKLQAAAPTALLSSAGCRTAGHCTPGGPPCPN